MKFVVLRVIPLLCCFSHYVFYDIKVVKSLEYFIVNIFLAIRKFVWYHLPALVSKYWREVASALHRNTEN